MELLWVVEGVVAARLAQLEDWVAPEITPLPEPPLFERLLFESPLLLAIAAVVIGLVAMFALVSRGKRKAALVVLACGLASGGGSFVLGGAVETERERLDARTRELVAVTVASEIDRLGEMLTEDARVDVPQVSRAEIPLGTLLGEGYLAAQLARAAGVRDHGIREVQAHADGPNVARTQVSLWVQPGDGGRTGSWWLMDWQRGGDGVWRARRITCLWLQGFGAS
ncbi:MAG: hypothetical protein AAF235_02260 [Planctomycetota bacterium]